MIQVHIVVRDGLIQAVYTDTESKVDITIHDLDTDNYDDILEAEAFITQLATYAKRVY